MDFLSFSSEEQTVVETAAESLATSGQSAMFGDVKPTPAWLKMLYDILFAAILFVVSKKADLIAALSLEAFDGRIDPFMDCIQQIRPHKGQIETGANFR